MFWRVTVHACMQATDERTFEAAGRHGAGLSAAQREGAVRVAPTAMGMEERADMVMTLFSAGHVLTMTDSGRVIRRLSVNGTVPIIQQYQVHVLSSRRPGVHLACTDMYARMYVRMHACMHAWKCVTTWPC